MKIGLHYDLDDKMSDFCLRYEIILKYNNIEFKRFFINDPDFWSSLAKVDFFIFRWWHTYNSTQLASTILPIIEKHLHKQTFPSLKTCWHFDDKIKQFYLLNYYNFPVTKSFIFWNKDSALSWINSIEFPIVFKLKNGAGSSNVALIYKRNNAVKLIKACFGHGIDSIQASLNEFIKIKLVIGDILRFLKIRKKASIEANQTQRGYAFFQEFLPNNEYDIRITIIGQRAFAFRRFNRDNDFRASGSGKIDYSPDHIDKKAIKLAFEISKTLEFQSMAYDFLYNVQNDLEICEISYTFSDLAIYNCPGYWDNKGNWHSGHYWPQYFHLIDLLNISLNQPPIKEMTPQ